MFSRFSEPSIELLTCSAEPSSGPSVDMSPGVASVDAARELRRDHVLVAMARDRPADELLVGQRAVELRGVEEVDAELERALDRRDRLVFVGRAVERRHSHAAEAER